MVFQYHVLFDLFYAGDHTGCAPIKDIIVTLMCIDLMMNCIVGLKNTINIIIETINWTDTLIWPYMMSTPLLSVPFVWNLSCFFLH